MRIGLDNVDLSSRTGPNAFGLRLAEAFSRLGHTVDTGCEGCDVVLAFIQQTRSFSSSKVVQRLDGIWFSPEEYHVRNTGIKGTYDTCSAVVWQSTFDRKMVEKWWGPKKGNVVHNGIARPPSGTTKVPVRWGADIVGKVFVCAANWHPQKRLAANIDMFIHLHETQCPDSCLFVLGSDPDVKVKHPRIRYMGSLDDVGCRRIYSAADWLIHLAWLDHCPNVVVEALSMGCQVIASDSGGTAEILNRDHDIIVSEVEKYDFRLTNYDRPPYIDVRQVPFLPPPPSTMFRALDIEQVALQYLSTFEEVA